MPKYIKFNNYKGSTDDLYAFLQAEAKEDGTAVERFAYQADRLYNLTNGGSEVVLHKNDNLYARNGGLAYGLKFRDLWINEVSGDYLGFEYQRTGTLADYAASEQVPDTLLPIQRSMRRCVVGYDGVVQYYLDADNSMWKEGSAIPQSTANAQGIITDLVDDYAAGNIIVTPSAGVSADKIGCVMNIFDGVAHNFWYAVIIGVDETAGTYTLSHPHITGWGTVGTDQSRYYMIGDAKLGGQDGNVMVEIPGFWHKHSYEPTTDDDPALFKFLGWQEHQISFSPIYGGTYYPKRYVAAFEGISADANSNPYDGWTGTYTNTAGDITWNSPSETATPTKILSVAGYYPRTRYSMDSFRPSCAATGVGYHQYDFTTNFMIQLLMIIEGGTFNTQAAYGMGISSVNGGAWSAYNYYRAMRKTGDTIMSGNKTWDMTTLSERQMIINDITYGIQSLSYRGIENPYGHIFKWVDGFTFINNEPGVGDEYYTGYAHKSIDGGVTDPSEFVSHQHHEDAAADTNYRTLKGLDGNTLKIINSNRYMKQVSPNFMPNDDATSDSSYGYDFFYYGDVSDDVARVFAAGGSANNGVNGGAFCVRSNYGSGSTYYYYGGRLCKKG